MERLEKRIKIVRTARIEAAKRYRKENEFYRKLTIVYSIFITCLSIWFVIERDSINSLALSAALLTLATFVTLFTMYTSIKNPGEKVGRFQSNYMELTRLLSEIQSYRQIIKSGAINPDCHTVMLYPKASQESLIQLTLKFDYDKFSKRYASLLTQSDNHEDIDYFYAIRREEDEKSDKGKIKIDEANINISRFEKINLFKRIIATVSLPFIFGILILLEKLFIFLF